jgi:hypothetical protein
MTAHSRSHHPQAVGHVGRGINSTVGNFVDRIRQFPIRVRGG